MFFRLERSRALFTFLCVCLPLSIEITTGIKLQSIIGWEIIIPTYTYMLLAHQATRTSNEIHFRIYTETCRIMLVVVVFYSWLSATYNMKSAIIDCVLPLSGIGNYLIECKRYGLGKNCIDGISHINRMNSARTRCPVAILGPTLGGWYMLVVIIFRFIPTGIYGLWNLYTWNSKRFMKGDNLDTNVQKNIAIVPSNRILNICTLILLPCVLGEVSVSHIKPLSSINCIHYFIVIILIQNTIQSCSVEIRSPLVYIQKLCFYTGMIFLFLDLCNRSMEIIMTCYTGDKTEKHLKDMCAHLHGVGGMERCYMALSDVDPTHFLRDGCPSSFFHDIQSSILYCSNIIKVIVMSVGLLMSFTVGGYKRMH